MAEIFFYERPGAKPSSVVPDTLTDKSRPSRTRRTRTQFSDADIRLLDAAFLSEPYPDVTERENLADMVGVPEARIQTWFQNKRSRTKRRHGALPTPSVSRPRKADSVEVALPAPPAPAPVRPLRASVPSPNPTGSSVGGQSPWSYLATPTLAQRSPSLSPNRQWSPQAAQHCTSSPLDLSIKSSEDSGNEQSSRTTRDASSPLHSDAKRPFFTPWATPPHKPIDLTAKPKPAFLSLPPPSSPFLIHPYAPFPNPWLYGCIAAHERNYLQRPMTSHTDRVHQYMLDTLGQVSPGLTPLVRDTSAIAASDLSPSMTGGNFFVFPTPLLTNAASDAASSSSRESTPTPDSSSDQQSPMTSPSVSCSGGSGYYSGCEDIDVCG